MSTTEEAEATTDDALTCPLCDYDLRGLPEHRCPECGHAFDPDELRRQVRARKTWFFEAAPPRTAARAFVLTTLASLWPPHFWRRVQPGDAIHARRLRTWVAAWFAITVAALLAITTSHVFLIYQTQNAFAAGPVMIVQVAGRSVLSAGGPSVTWRDAAGRAFANTGLQASGVAAALAFAWPVAAFGVMSLFGATLAQAGIHSGHLWRCGLYAIPSLVLPPLVGAAIAVSGGLVRGPPGLVAVAMAWLSTAHLFMAHVRYLRVRHAAAQAIVVQVLIALGSLAAIALVNTGR